MEERSPLLGREQPFNPPEPQAPPMAPPPSYSEIQQEISASGFDDSSPDAVKCEVCNYMINKTVAKNKKVITCPRCQEATALGEPERGKRYLRCPECNCLLIFGVDCRQTICPRANCKTKIDVRTGKPVREQASTSASVPPGESINQEPQYRIVCGYCHGAFVQSTLPPRRLQCPLCRRKSHIGEGAGRRTAVCHITIGLACIIACLALMATTMGLRHNAGYWYIYMILLVLAVVFIVMGLWSLCMRHSTLQIANPTV